MVAAERAEWSHWREWREGKQRVEMRSDDTNQGIMERGGRLDLDILIGLMSSDGVSKCRSRSLSVVTLRSD